MFGSAFTDTNLLTGIFLIIGALLFIISTPTIISTLLNQQSGTMTAFGDMQSLMALGTGISHGLGIAQAGTSLAFSVGSKVAGKSANLIGGGISNMLNKGKLTPDQKNAVKQTMETHNSYKAQQQVEQFLKDNGGIKSSNNVANNSLYPFMHTPNLKYDSIRNRYLNRNDLNDRKGN